VSVQGAVVLGTYSEPQPDVTVLAGSVDRYRHRHRHRQPSPERYVVTERRRRGEVVTAEAIPDLEIAVDEILG
jgi:hypothetical protein